MTQRLRVHADSGRGLGHLVIAVLDIVRDLLERQALHRVDSGSLAPDEIERLGQALIALDRQFTELRAILARPQYAPDPLPNPRHKGHVPSP